MYTKQFTDPNPNGWANPSVRPPVIVSSMQAHTDAIKGIDNYLYDNASDYRVIDVTEDMDITIKNYGHTYLVLNFYNTVYTVNFVKSDTTDTSVNFKYHGGLPVFQANTSYELSFLNLDCVYIKREV